jgi:hypothetical protein
LLDPCQVAAQLHKHQQCQASLRRTTATGPSLARLARAASIEDRGRSAATAAIALLVRARGEHLGARWQAPHRTAFGRRARVILA